MPKKNEIKAPKKLLDICRLAARARRGYFVLDELPGIYAFQARIAEHLLNEGWDIEKKVIGQSCYIRDCDMETYERTKFLEHMISTHAHGPRFIQAGQLEDWLNMGSYAKESAYFRDDKNIDALGRAVKAAIHDLTPTYGDVFAVKHHQRSLLRAGFDAVREKLRPGAPSKETLLKNALRDINKAMKNCLDKQGVPYIEFQGRLEEALAKKGWPIREDGDIHRPLASELWSLAYTASHKTSLAFRYVAQDDNMPPRKPYRQAKDFLFDHIDDLAAAVKDVTTEIDDALSQASEITTRHCVIIGSKQDLDGQKRRNRPSPPQ